MRGTLNLRKHRHGLRFGHLVVQHDNQHGRADPERAPALRLGEREVTGERTHAMFRVS